MKTLRWTCAALVVAALSGCFFFDYVPGPTVDLEAGSTWIVTGEETVLSADASDPRGGGLAYEWYEDDERIVGAADSELAYRTWADESRRDVEISVIVRDGSGRFASDSVHLTVDPRSDGTVVLVNHSSEDVWYVYSRLNDGAWSADQLGFDIVPSGETYVILGYSTGWWDEWDVKAESRGGTCWQVDDFYVSGPGDVRIMTIVD